MKCLHEKVCMKRKLPPKLPPEPCDKKHCENFVGLEQLARLEHKQWSHWIKFQLKTIPHLLEIADFARWERLAETPYEKLSEKEKESDRSWARKLMAGSE